MKYVLNLSVSRNKIIADRSHDLNFVGDDKPTEFPQSRHKVDRQTDRRYWE